MLQLYNSLTHQKEPLVPLEPGLVKIYSCGPTVYRYIHIGNLRTFCMADWLRRTLLMLGLQVLHVKNITDVGHMRVELLDRGEDKLIAQARKEGKSSGEIAAFYTEAFLQDEAALQILPAHVLPRATEHIPEMIEIIRGLLAKGLAYSAGGTIYFDVARFPEYGKLSGNLLATLLAGVRDTSDPHKRNPEDFALWKTAEPGRELAWESPWGRGFPGWHIECSAMSMKYLGPHFDIHTGGVDNLFPHHEDEIAQSEGFTGQRFVNTWLHAQHLLADGLKMAKSTGNAYTRADIEARGFEALALRYLYATTHYRSRLNFTFSALRAAQTGLQRLRLAFQHLAQQAEHSDSRPTDLTPSEQAALAHYRERFQAALTNDLNLPQALAVTWQLVRREPALPACRKLALLSEFDQVLGFALNQVSQPKTSAMPPAITAILHERSAMRVAGRYAESDLLRNQLRAAGWEVRDTSTGTLVQQLAADEEFPQITRSLEVPDQRGQPDLYDLSVNLVARDNRADLERCITSIVRQRGSTSLEIVVIDNGSTDGTVAYLQDLARTRISDSHGQPVPLRIVFADHNMGFAAGRNATMRTSRGRVIVLLDTSIELTGDIWPLVLAALEDHEVGLVGPYGLVTRDLKEFQEHAGPDVDAIEGYLMAFRRSLLDEIGWFDEKFRFYRLLDIHTSFFIKVAGYRVVAIPELTTGLAKHPHREWYALTEEERVQRSKKNFDIYYRRWHHGQSLMVCNYAPEARWYGHNHHTHLPEEQPPPGQPHIHSHQHWPDHAHEHPHYHEA